MSGMYKAGKSGGMISAAIGKKAPAGIKVSASAGKSSGTRREGDKAGCSPMSKGGK